MDVEEEADEVEVSTLVVMVLDTAAVMVVVMVLEDMVLDMVLMVETVVDMVAAMVRGTLHIEGKIVTVLDGRYPPGRILISNLVFPNEWSWFLLCWACFKI